MPGHRVRVGGLHLCSLLQLVVLGCCVTALNQADKHVHRHCNSMSDYVNDLLQMVRREW